MEPHDIVTSDQWLAARKDLLAKEKALTRLRDEVTRARQALPWERVSKRYSFQGSAGTVSLDDLFDGRSQLIVYHFMYGPDWSAPCKSCSWWADNFERNVVHLRQRDVTLAAISRASIDKLLAFQARMGWTFPWYSSDGGDFNFDYQASFTPEAIVKGEVVFNYAPSATRMTDLPGISVFYRDPTGGIFHTYSCYGRGVEMMNAGYQYLDLVPKGRDEAGLPYSQAWVRYRDEYAT